jgi:hypothetical protein
MTFINSLSEENPKGLIAPLFTIFGSLLMRYPKGLIAPLFTISYVGGQLHIYREGRTKWRYYQQHNHHIDIQSETFDPWFEQDRIFIEAVRSGDDKLILNDYHDGLFSLAPVLAGLESSRRNGEPININTYLDKLLMFEK